MTLLKILAAAALIAAASAGLAVAQPPPPAPNSGLPGAMAPQSPPSPALIAARRNMRASCAADMAKLCPDARPGPGGGLGQCMMQHRAEISPPCRDARMALRQARQASR